MISSMLVASLVAISAHRLDDSNAGVHPDEFSFAHITDPQLGMLAWTTSNPHDITQEADVLEKGINFAKAMKLDFVFMGGDMQNWWPNEPEDTTNRNLYEDGTKKGFGLDFSADLGSEQRKRVKEIVDKVRTQVLYTPGDHDIGDDPDEKTLARYEEYFGHHFAVWANPGHWAHVVRINSQLYWTDSQDAAVTKWRTFQDMFLRTEMRRMDTESKKLLVVLTHICPFLDGTHKTSSSNDKAWALWKPTFQESVMETLTKPGKPVLFVCGHMHVNVKNHIQYNKVDVYIRVTSSAGTTIHWDGKKELTPVEAQAVASKPIQLAFNEHIVAKDVANIPKRLQADADSSGMRLFKFFNESSRTCFKDKWFTVSDLSSSADALADLEDASEVCV
eukprot:TRINITY_DN1643_c1_g3_i1.p1 TRINITY_DN1643_c1_g3~~TRINITY_DN1643_c1_g3_i1.p1  ORF type:complete len:390 (+),score=48.81 TRINITY_DN1643_c1_g3_i1:88-1257(+)